MLAPWVEFRQHRNRMPALHRWALIQDGRLYICTVGPQCFRGKIQSLKYNLRMHNTLNQGFSKWGPMSYFKGPAKEEPERAAVIGASVVGVLVPTQSAASFADPLE